MNQSINKSEASQSQRLWRIGTNPLLSCGTENASVSTDPKQLLCPVSSRVFLWVNQLTMCLCEVQGAPPVWVPEGALNKALVFGQKHSLWIKKSLQPNYGAYDLCAHSCLIIQPPIPLLDATCCIQHRRKDKWQGVYLSKL